MNRTASGLVQKSLLGRLGTLAIEGMLMGDVRLMYPTDEEYWKWFNNVAAYFVVQLDDFDGDLEVFIDVKS